MRRRALYNTEKIKESEQDTRNERDNKKEDAFIIYQHQ